jgi:glycosyltransferase involved in cell wall biosynthesis
MNSNYPKKNILFESWYNIPHSYSIVNTFQIINFYKLYSENYSIYLKNCEYPDIYKDKWKQNLDNSGNCSIYSDEYNKILSCCNVYNENLHKNVNFDIIYRLTYPYNISIPNEENLKNAKIYVFYTAEFKNLDPSYFKLNDKKILDDNIIKEHITKYKNKLEFITPSEWSIDSMNKYLGKSHLIPHGIDENIFYKKEDSEINAIKKKYNINPDDFVFLQLGSMTSNKGIVEILIGFCYILKYGINNNGVVFYPNIKLLLKGISEMYNSVDFVKQYIKQLYNATIEINGKSEKMFNETDIQKLYKNIILIDNTLSFKMLNNLYNLCDVYISPYKAEGFNLTVLESLACGCDIIVSDNGSTSFFVNDILNNVENSNKIISILKTEMANTNEYISLNYSLNDLILLMCNKILQKESNDNVSFNVSFYTREKYSWKNVAKEMNKLIN